MSRKKKKSLFRRFITTVLTLVIGFLVVAGAGLWVYDKWFDGDEENFVPPPILDVITDKGVNMNVAVFGVDEDGTRTDVIFIVHFDSKTKEVGLLSVPRDTYVEICQPAKDIMDANDRWYPDVCKINEVHSYAGKEHGPECSVLQLEDLLGIKIDHYAKIDLAGFREVVDIIGGVDVYVPQDMYHDDPYINLKEGDQHLDGALAEQLVRFRSYPLGDETRVAVQQSFLKAFASKILNTKTILSNLPSLLSAAFEYLDTDISLTDALKYVKYVDDISLDNIEMEILPGVGQYVGKVSYFLHDEVETKNVVDRIFFGIDPYEGTSKGLVIEVANGGNITGLAGKKQAMLQAEGYQVDTISTFDGEQTEHTRIVIREDGVGEDLLAYFPDSVFVIDETMLSPGTDIKVILGLNETDDET